MSDTSLHKVKISAQNLIFACILLAWSSTRCNKKTPSYKAPTTWPSSIKYSNNLYVNDRYQYTLQMLAYHFVGDFLMKLLILSVKWNVCIDKYSLLFDNDLNILCFEQQPITLHDRASFMTTHVRKSMLAAWVWEIFHLYINIKLN